ncbi:MAG: cysteine--tRNA ligase [Chloroflexi bacterium]|nr:cysteine--tRNA ligase [Chloroflexota bacterium]MQC27285.1 cysteine--tRNA ligase [Chloroflexota bacterium]
MTLQIYNTLSRKKEPFEPLEAGKVSMYVCGPTVYADAHIGHAMSSLVFDVVRRYLEYCGYQVRHVMNYTDVDDKIIQRANHEGRDSLELAQEYIDAYNRHIEDLNILPANVFPKATEEIDQIVEMTARLMDDGFAYSVDGDVYYRVERKDDYGKLSGRKLADMQAGSRVGVDERKEHPMDFALWKSAKEGEPSWETPWGAGRPGWHIECSAMALHHLGPQIDIHGGGNDLVFPHHENEIAQTESLTGKPFARYWMHNGMLQLSGEKMSKSIGNLVTINDFLKEHEADVLRILVLNSSYRSPLSYNDEVLEAATRGLERLRSGLRPALPGAQGAAPALAKALDERTAASKEGFIAAMDDDFNTSSAMAELFDLVRRINQARDESAKDEDLKPAQTLLLELSGLLGLNLAHQVETEIDPADLIAIFEEMRAKLGDAESSQALGVDVGSEDAIRAILKLREKFREAKQWAASDEIRDRLAALGVLVEDNAQGSSWRWG